MTTRLQSRPSVGAPAIRQCWHREEEQRTGTSDFFPLKIYPRTTASIQVHVSLFRLTNLQLGVFQNIKRDDYDSRLQSEPDQFMEYQL